LSRQGSARRRRDDRGGLAPRTALTLAVAAAVASSASGPFGKSLILSGWSTGGVLLSRTTIATLVLLPAAVWLALRHGARLRENAAGIAVLGAVGIAGTVICYYNAVAALPVAVAMIILYVSPVLVLAWLWLRHGDRPAARTLAGAVVSLGGLLLVVAATGVDERASPTGIAWALGGALCVATYFLASDRITGSVPPVTLACAGLAVASAGIGLLALVGLLPVGITSAPAQLGGWTVSPAVPLALVVLVSTIFVYVAAFAAVSVLGARVTSFVALAEPIAALGVAWALLGEVPRPLQLVGAALVVAGVALIRTDRSDRVRRSLRADEDTEPFLAEPG